MYSHYSFCDYFVVSVFLLGKMSCTDEPCSNYATNFGPKSFLPASSAKKIFVSWASKRKAVGSVHNSKNVYPCVHAIDKFFIRSGCKTLAGQIQVGQGILSFDKLFLRIQREVIQKSVR